MKKFLILLVVAACMSAENFKKDVAFIFKRPELLIFRGRFFSPSLG